MRSVSAGLMPVFHEADRTGDLKAAWTNGGRPTTYRNAFRQYKEYQKKEAAAAAQKAYVQALRLSE